MFANRMDAGRRLGTALKAFKREHPIVYGLPRTGASYRDFEPTSEEQMLDCLDRPRGTTNS
jgi:predicted phosphoribosyltransferase